MPAYLDNASITDCLPINWDACRQYVLSRQTIDGGFCFYRVYGVEESNALDAYSAVVALGCMKTTIPRQDDLAAWLQAQQNPCGDYAGLPTAWYVLEALRLLDLDPTYAPHRFLQTQHDQFVSKLRVERALDWSSVLSSANRLTCLLQACKIPLSLEFKEDLKHLLQELHGEQGGYGWPSENLIDTATVAEIQARLGWHELPKGMAFAKVCVDEQTGFQLVPDSSANSLEAIHAGLVIFKLGQQILPKAVALASLRFIGSCQSANGGFGRTVGAIPTLSDTRLALESLKHLSALPI